jgi:hypothetical protein
MGTRPIRTVRALWMRSSQRRTMPDTCMFRVVVSFFNASAAREETLDVSMCRVRLLPPASRSGGEGGVLIRSRLLNVVFRQKSEGPEGL